MGRGASWAVAIATLLAAVATGWGLLHHGLFAGLATASPDWAGVLGLVAIAAGAAELLSRRYGLDRCTAAVPVAAVLAVLAGEGGAALALALLAAASFVLGHAILRALGCNAQTLPSTVRLTVGAAILGSVVGLAAHAPLAYPVTYGAALLVCVITGRRILAHELASLRSPLTGRSPVASWPDRFLAALGLYFVAVAFMPEIGHDALATHLFVPAHLALRHGWSFDPTLYVWALMPMLGDWLFGVGYVLAGEAGARLVNIGGILLACRLVGELAMLAGASRTQARWACLLFLSTPVVYTEASSLFIESVWSCTLLAASLMLLKLVSTPRTAASTLRDQLLPAGFLAGGALAAKAVSFTTLPALLLVLFACWRRFVDRSAALALGAATVAALALGLLPYAWAWHVTGNPVFPFFNQVFKSPLWPPIAFEPPAVFDKGIRWDLFWRMTFDTGRYLEAAPGAAGYQWMLLAVPAALAVILARRKVALWLLMFVAVSVALTFHSTAYLRYVLPAYGWLAAAIGAAMAAIPAISARAAITLATALACLLNVLFLHAGTNQAGLKPMVLLGPIERERYLAERQPMRNLVPVLNAINDPGSPVAVFGPPLLAGLAADAIHASWYNHRFLDEVMRASDADALGEILDRRRIEHVVLDEAWSERARRDLVRRVTDLVAQVGGIELRRLSHRYSFRTELLRSPLALADWQFPAGRLPAAEEAVVVDVSRPAVQEVAVEPGRRYQLTVRARCLSGQAAKGRLQVNWLDRRRVVHVSIQPFDCLPDGGEHWIVWTAPSHAGAAAVYATGHADAPLIIDSVSFRQ